MALLDEGETDWKVIVVDVQDPLAAKLNDIEDVERHLPGLIRATNEWFRYEKTSFPSHADFDNGYTGSTKSPMESLKTPLLSLEKPRTSVTLPRLSMSATSHGAVLSLAKSQPRLLHTIFPCVFPHTRFSNHVLHPHSRNITIQNSVGFTKRDEPVYTEIPSDSRKPPAPIDASSELPSIWHLFSFSQTIYSLQMVLHLFRKSICLPSGPSHQKRQATI
jgi:inorganic pyrophosphatase